LLALKLGRGLNLPVRAVVTPLHPGVVPAFVYVAVFARVQVARAGLPRTTVALVVLNFLRRFRGQSGYELEAQRPNGGSALGVLFADSVKTRFIAV
jgi:hypothetical protein